MVGAEPPMGGMSGRNAAAVNIVERMQLNGGGLYRGKSKM